MGIVARRTETGVAEKTILFLRRGPKCSIFSNAALACPACIKCGTRTRGLPCNLFILIPTCNRLDTYVGTGMNITYVVHIYLSDYFILFF